MRQELRKIASINKILAAAEEYIKKSSIEEIDIDEICKQAGLTKGAFYHHFKSKQHLLLELFNRWVTKVASRLDISLSADRAVTEIIFDIMDRIQPLFEQNEKQLPIFLKLYLDGISDKDLKKPVMESYKSFLTFFTQIVITGSKKDSIKNENPEEISKILFALTVGLLVQGLITPKGANWSELAKKSVKMLLGP